jgi:hypothetical protein
VPRGALLPTIDHDLPLTGVMIRWRSLATLGTLFVVVVAGAGCSDDDPAPPKYGGASDCGGDAESGTAAATASCYRVSVDGMAPGCRLSGSCRTGEHELDCSGGNGSCSCQSTSPGIAADVPYEPGFCVSDGSPTSSHARFAVAARACRFPL